MSRDDCRLFPRNIMVGSENVLWQKQPMHDEQYSGLAEMKDHLKAEYDRRDLEAMSAGNNYHRWILDQISPFVGKCVVEVGAGSGNFSTLLLQLSVDRLFAVEPAFNMYPLLKKALEHWPNAISYVGRLQDVVGVLDQRPDTVTYINVLEHIADDEAELICAHDLLVERGHLCLFVPALQWLYGTNDAAVGHYRRYNREPLLELVKRAGFQIEICRYMDFVGIMPWFLLFKILRQPGVRRGQINAYDRLVVPIIRRLENLVNVPAGKNLLVIGRKS